MVLNIPISFAHGDREAICTDCRTEKPILAFRLTAQGNPRARCRDCDKRRERARDAHAPLTIGCGFDGCGEMFATPSGAGSHRRKTHGVRGIRTQTDGAVLSPRQLRQIEIVRRRAVRGEGDGYMDSSGLVNLLFVDSRRRATTLATSVPQMTAPHTAPRAHEGDS